VDQDDKVLRFCRDPCEQLLNASILRCLGVRASAFLFQDDEHMKQRILHIGPLVLTVLPEDGMEQEMRLGVR
jgi:hypothetical protein